MISKTKIVNRHFEDEDYILTIFSIAMARVLESSSSSVITVTPAKSAIKEAFLNDSPQRNLARVSTNNN